MTKQFSWTKLIAVCLLLTGLITTAIPVAAAGTVDRQTDATGYVTTARLNVRSGPYFTYSVVVIVDKGQGFTIVGRNTPANWLQIKLPSGIIGWVKAAYVKTDAALANLPVTGDADVAATTSGSAVVATGRLNVRTAPDPYSKVLTTVDRGATVSVIGRNASGSWFQVKTGSGVLGWVKTVFVRANIAARDLPMTAP